MNIYERLNILGTYFDDNNIDNLCDFWCECYDEVEPKERTLLLIASYTRFNNVELNDVIVNYFK